MQVCHLCLSTVDTHYFANLGKGFASSGLKVIWGTLYDSRSPSWMNQLDGTEYFSLGVRGRAHYPLAIARLAWFLRRKRVDILQTHLFDAGILGIIAARLARTPVVVLTRHHLDQVHLIGNRFHVWLDRWMAKQADHVVVLSNAVKNFMVSVDKIDAKKVEVIHQGFDFESLEATEKDRERIRNEFGLDSRFVIGCVGQLFETKGQKHLILALKELAKEIPEGHLLLVGGGDRKPLEDLARDLGLQNRITFAGYRKDIAACFSAMDMVVHPSLSEAFCQVLIEAMAVGKPLVSTDVGGAPEVITQGETGILVPPEDSMAIARAILDLYRLPERREQLARNAQSSVRKRFPVSLMVERQLSCYSRLLKDIPSQRS